MSDDLSLFGDDEPREPSAPVTAPTPVAAWQIELLRKALDSRGLTSMDDRRAAVEEAIGRPVESLRDLTAEEALRALGRLGGASSRRLDAAAAWDERDEDTWIDRL